MHNTEVQIVIAPFLFLMAKLAALPVNTKCNSLATVVVYKNIVGVLVWHVVRASELRRCCGHF